ncbi:MAG TPA: CHAD domain-containing protein [Solirubrobacteraceae bacterium]
MKARKVKGLDCDAPLAENAQRIVGVRLGELLGFVPCALDPEEVEALHDMRIAAKRLRYVLELTEDCFGPFGREARRQAKELQDVLGDIHDCDVLLPQVDGALAECLRDRRRVLFDRFLALWGTTVGTS